MGRLIPFDSNGRQTVSEVDLHNIVALQEKIASAQAKVDLIAAGVVDRMKAGAEAEDDCPYRARLERVEVSGVIEDRLMVDGVCRWRRISGSAAALRRNPGVLAQEPS